MTGATRGVGHDLAFALAAAGARAVAAVRRRDQARAGLEAVDRDMRDVGSIRAAIDHISSQAGHVAIKRNAAHCASKSGVETPTKVLALEWGPSGRERRRAGIHPHPRSTRRPSTRRSSSTT